MRVRALVALVVLAIVVTTGGLALLVARDGSVPSTSGPADTPAPTVSSSPTAGLPTTDKALARYYEQRLDWHVCEDHADFQCATMRVPLDYAKPAGRDIGIALLRVPATDQDTKVGALVVNPGGPGAPGTQYAAVATSVFRRLLTGAFDVVGFDPRGTGDSANVDCLSDEDLNSYLAGDPDPDTPAEVSAYERDTSKFLKGCAEKSGPLAAHVSTIEAARDIDVLRALLGEKRLNYFGASYGTKLGATYALLFPEHVGRLVLDGAVDLELSSRDSLLGQAGGFEIALKAYLEDCVYLGDCFLGDTVEAGAERLQKFLADVDANPLPAGDRELTVGNALYGVITPLYNRDYWVYLTTALKEAFDGDGTTLMLLADAYASRTEDGRFTDNSVEANYNINCLDDPMSFPVADVPAQIPAFEKVSPTFGRALAWSLTGCNDFTPRSTEPHPTGNAAGAAPILVVGTTRDPATPYAWAVALADELASAVLVTRDGDGHTGYNAGNDCVDKVIEDYLVNGKVPAADVDCPAP